MDAPPDRADEVRPPPRGLLDDGQRAVVRGLADGLTLEAVAQHLGLGIYAVQSRFEKARRAWAAVRTAPARQSPPPTREASSHCPPATPGPSSCRSPSTR